MKAVVLTEDQHELLVGVVGKHKIQVWETFNCGVLQSLYEQVKNPIEISDEMLSEETQAPGPADESFVPFTGQPKTGLENTPSMMGE